MTSLKEIYPFEKFEEQINAFDRCINAQGLLILHFTQYRLKDTALANKYQRLGMFNQDDYSSPIFDINSNKIESPPSLNTIYIKTQP